MALLVGIPVVLQVAMRKYRQAVLDGDVPAQARHLASMQALKADSLTVEYVAWTNAGFPTIP
jgi:hypothetical protein